MNFNLKSSILGILLLVAAVVAISSRSGDDTGVGSRKHDRSTVSAHDSRLAGSAKRSHRSTSRISRRQPRQESAFDDEKMKILQNELAALIQEDEKKRSRIWDQRSASDARVTRISIEKPSPAEIERWEQKYSELRSKVPQKSRSTFDLFWKKLLHFHAFTGKDFRSIGYTEPFDPDQKSKMTILETDQLPTANTSRWTIISTSFLDQRKQNFPFDHLIQENEMK